MKNSNTIRWAITLFCILFLFSVISAIFLNLYVPGWHFFKCIRLLMLESVSLVFFLIPFLLIKWNLVKKIYWLFTIVLFFPNIIISYSLYKYMKIRMDYSVFFLLDDLMQWHLIKDFITSYLNLNIIKCCLLLVICIVFIFVLYKFLKFFFSLNIESKKSDYYIAFLVCGFLSILILGAYMTPYKNKVAGFWNTPWFINAFHQYLIYKNKPNVLNQISEKNLSEILKNFKDTSKSNICGVVMIGESLSRVPMSMYGYKRNTTPNMLKIIMSKNEGEIIRFQGKTRLKYTSPSLLQALSFSENNIVKKSAPIAKIMNAYGVKSYMLTSVYDTEFALKKLFDGMIYLGGIPTDVEISKWHDDNLVKIFFDKMNTLTSVKDCIFMHFQGSHFVFENKYPSKFKKFDNLKDVYTEQYKSPKDIYTYNTYDNTVLYFDSIFGSIATELNKRQEPSFILYFSDHGEGAVVDELRGATRENIERIYNVPLFIWFSESYIKIYPEVVKMMRLNSDKKEDVYIDEAVIYMILECMRISSKTAHIKNPIGYNN